MSKKVLITGGSGFIGTNLVEHFKSNGDDVLNIDVQSPRNSKHLDLWSQLDLLDQEKLRTVVQDFSPDIVFHMAARTDLGGSEISDYDANIQGVRNLITTLNTIDNLKKVIFSSSMLVCRLGYIPVKDDDYCPDTIYGRSKVCGEEIVRSAITRFPWIIVRPTSIWGPWFGTPYRDFFTAIKRNVYVHPNGLRVRRSYGFIYNVVYQLDCIGRALDNRLDSQTVYLADYEPIELKSWADKIQYSLHSRPVREVPFLILKIAARIGDLLKFLGLQNPPMNTSRLSNMCTEMVHNTDVLESYCGATPHSIDDGVEITCAWLRNHSDNI